MQSEQIMKPHGQVQQKLCSCEQALHIYFSGRRHLPFSPDFSKPLIFPSYEKLYTTLSRRISFLLRIPWLCTSRSAEGIPLGSSVMRFGPSAGCLVVWKPSDRDVKIIFSKNSRGKI